MWASDMSDSTDSASSADAASDSPSEPKRTSSDVQAEVMRLHYLEGLSIRSIATRMQMSRKTVRRCLGRPQKASKWPSPERASLLTPYVDEIERMLVATPELKAPQVLERLRALGYSGGISILRERMRRLRPRPAVNPHLVIHHQPGASLQIDWADFGFGLPGVPRRISAFVAVLPFSRMMYLEFTRSQAMGSFLRCMDRALEFFGGTANTDVFDNMKTVVVEHIPGRPPKFNPRFLQYANVRGGFAVVACAPHHPQSKGSVERGIGFVRDRFWQGRRFQDLLDLNAQASTWMRTWANSRKTRPDDRVPQLLFDNIERETLNPVPSLPFDTDDLAHDIVSDSCRVRFDRNTYSVPWHLVSQRVLIRADDETVRVFIGHRCVAEHERSWLTNKDVEAPAHRNALLESRRQSPERIAAARFGSIGKRYFEVLAASSRSLRREGVRLVCLAELFGGEETTSAMAEVMKAGHVGADYVEYVLRHKRGLQPAPDPIRLGDPRFDDISLSDPDLSLYDAPTLDPSEP